VFNSPFIAPSNSEAVSSLIHRADRRYAARDVPWPLADDVQRSSLRRTPEATLTVHFRDRRDAGRQLGRDLLEYADRADVIVLALPRGGVPVGYEVAQAIHAPLDVFIVRKLGVPGREEYAMGAIASGGIRLVDEHVVTQLHITERDIERVAEQEQRELERRERQYRGRRPQPDIAGRVAILVDDGLATGASMRVAVAALRQEHPGRIVVAVPVAPPETCDMLRREADHVVCAVTPEPFLAVGLWYEDFAQTTDEEVHELLERGRHELAPAPMPRR
jgi:putative phosphoribosyl transferase